MPDAVSVADGVALTCPSAHQADLCICVAQKTKLREAAGLAHSHTGGATALGFGPGPLQLQSPCFPYRLLPQGTQGFSPTNLPRSTKQPRTELSVASDSHLSLPPLVGARLPGSLLLHLPEQVPPPPWTKNDYRSKGMYLRNLPVLTLPGCPLSLSLPPPHPPASVENCHPMGGPGSSLITHPLG